MDILEDNNYQLDTQPESILKVVQKTANKVKSLATEPRSVSNTVFFPIGYKGYQPTPKLTGGVPEYYEYCNYLSLQTIATGGFPFVDNGSGSPEWIKPFNTLTKRLYKPSLYKLENIKAINLAYNLGIVQNSGQYYSPPYAIPVASSDYSIDFHLSLARYYGTSYSSGGFEELWTDKVTLNYDLSDNAFTLNKTEDIYDLADTIEERDTVTYLGTDFPDFTTNPTKITEAQLEYFKTETMNIVFMAGFDSTQYNALTGSNYNNTTLTSNKGHFQYNFYNYDTFISYSHWATQYYIDIEFFLSYFGLLTPYTPYSS